MEIVATASFAVHQTDWTDIKAEGDALLHALADGKRSDHDMQLCLAQMYVADARFTRYYDDVEPGLAQFLRDIIVARSDR